MASAITIMQNTPCFLMLDYKSSPDKFLIYKFHFAILPAVIQECKESSRVPREYSPREKKWIEFPGETPHSLVISSDFIKLIKPGNKVLDSGCGSGEKLILLSEKGIKGVGIDINAEEIAWNKKNFALSNIEFYVMNGTDLKFPERTFDYVTLTGVAGGVEPDVRKGLFTEAYRVLKLGGKLAVVEFKRRDDPEQKKKYEEDEKIAKEPWSKVLRNEDGETVLIVKHFTDEELGKLFKDAGFSEIESREYSVATEGITDGQFTPRQQFTVWGTKPLVD